MPHQNIRHGRRPRPEDPLDTFLPGVDAAADAAADDVLREDFAVRELGKIPSHDHRAGR